MHEIQFFSYTYSTHMHAYTYRYTILKIVATNLNLRVEFKKFIVV